jgi:hypothetical protein
MPTSATANDRRAADGRFALGQSGNPAGRPKGARNRATLLAEALREGEAEILIRRFVELALAGDRTALRFCVARLVPRLKGRLIELDLAPGAERDPAAIMDAALRAVVAGEITPDEALALARLVKQRDAAAKKSPPVSDLYPSVPPASSPALDQHARKKPAGTPAVRTAPAASDAPPVFDLYSSVPPASSPASGRSAEKEPAGTPAVRTESVVMGVPPVSGLYFGDMRAPREIGDLLASCSKLALGAKAPLARAA